MSKFCSQCGAAVRENEKFCSSCGARLASAVEPASATETVNLNKPTNTTPPPASDTQPASAPPPANANEPASNFQPESDVFVEDTTPEEMFLKMTGRLNRLRYFKRLFILGVAQIILVGIVVALFVDNWGRTTSFGEALLSIGTIVLLIPEYCLSIRRLHDMDKNEIIARISLVAGVISAIYPNDPFDPSSILGFSPVNMVLGLIQLAIMFYLCLMPGVRGANQYGADPLG